MLFLVVKQFIVIYDCFSKADSIKCAAARQLYKSPGTLDKCSVIYLFRTMISAARLRQVYMQHLSYRAYVYLQSNLNKLEHTKCRQMLLQVINVPK